MRFEDHFSQHAQDYARFRPAYPDSLFAYLASVTPATNLAWDCGTGNGQAAVQLANYFDRVVATDASAEQIARAFPHERVEYRVQPAEAVSLGSSSVDLVTVAVAVHWFDLDAFYREARRVLKPRGVIAVWTYHLPLIEPEVDRILATYTHEVLEGYWPERIHYLMERYTTLPFPFDELNVPPFEMEYQWTLAQLIGFLDSWSATRRYREANTRHPVEEIWDELRAAWGHDDRTRLIHWPLYLRVGRVG
jgi:ubiquinone/menaquinone biosynthesis C-methylase UbiE